MQISVGILTSGTLGNTILKYIFQKEYIIVGFVFTNKKSDDIISFCRRNNIPLFIGNPRKNKQGLDQFKNDKPVDYIFSINYLYIVEKDILKHPKRSAINIHGSLLPKYRGRTPHVWAIINGEKETGISAHIMDEGCDTGAIIKQMTIPISFDDTGNDLLIKYHDNYPIIVDSIIKDIKSSELRLTYQDESKATFFGKRSPEDGMINWNWQKERIRNWIRAQSYPYPGAFTFYKGQKVIIDEVEYSDLGYYYNICNGIILKYDSVPYVKTPNGVLKITKIRDSQLFHFETDTKFEENYGK